MSSTLKRIEHLEAKAAPSGLLVQRWEIGSDGLAFTSYGVQRIEQQGGESLEQCLERFAQAIPRRPLVWAGPLDAAL